jgi:hypothetical protein
VVLTLDSTKEIKLGGGDIGRSRRRQGINVRMKDGEAEE